jgi:hypothetical protein
MPELDTLRACLTLLIAHLQGWRADDGSITLEQILITTTLVGAALVAGVAIMKRVNDAARAIPTGQ